MIGKIGYHESGFFLNHKIKVIANRIGFLISLQYHVTTDTLNRELTLSNMESKLSEIIFNTKLVLLLTALK